MKEQWQQRYEDLTSDLATNLHEEGLAIAERHWKALHESVEHYEFASKDEEIHFFKLVKPLFTSKLELFHLLKAGIKNPFIRLQKFKEKHTVFCSYYQLGLKTEDHKWFVRVPGTTSTHDHLVAQLLALQQLVQRSVLTA